MPSIKIKFSADPSQSHNCARLVVYEEPRPEWGDIVNIEMDPRDVFELAEWVIANEGVMRLQEPPRFFPPGDSIAFRARAYQDILDAVEEDEQPFTEAEERQIEEERAYFVSHCLQSGLSGYGIKGPILIGIHQGRMEFSFVRNGVAKGFPFDLDTLIRGTKIALDMAGIPNTFENGSLRLPANAWEVMCAGYRSAKV